MSKETISIYLRERLRRVFPMQNGKRRRNPNEDDTKRDSCFCHPNVSRRYDGNGFARIFPFFFVIVFFLLGIKGEASVAREVKVGVAVAESYKAVPEWQEKFKQRLTYASKIFENEFGISFHPVAWVDWSPADTSDMNALFEDLKSKFPLVDMDLVIGLCSLKFSPAMNVNDSHIIGRARPFSGYLVLRHPVNPLFKIQEETVLVHELGHLFGAIHTTEPNTVMSPVVAKQIPARFDPVNREIIQVTRGIDFRKGSDALDQKSIEFLLQSYLKLIDTGQSFEFYYALGNLYLKSGQGEEARQTWLKAVELDDNSASIHYDFGVLCYELGRYDEAVSHLTRAAGLYSNPNQSYYKASALHMIGNAYYKKDAYQAAFNSWAQALALRPGDLDLQVNLAVARMKQGEYGEAVDQFQKAIKRGSQNPTVFSSLGLAYYNLNDYSNAIEFFKRALSAVSSSDRGPITALDRIKPAEIHAHLGYSYMKMNDLSSAVAHFEVACQLDPSVGCHRNLGQIYYQLKKWDECIRELSGVLSQEKSDPDDYGMLGVAFSQKGENAKAIFIFEEGLKQSSDRAKQAHFHTNLGNLYLQNKETDVAMRQFQFAIDKNWNDADSHVGLAVAYLQQNQTERARESLKHALSINPNHADAKNLLAQIEAHLGR